MTITKQDDKKHVISNEVRGEIFFIEQVADMLDEEDFSLRFEITRSFLTLII
ncbi:hypothetical protein GCM10023149_12280 [Mucilaginibacter gynuensis]|uniref:Uncharacterized protein n=1 Tax=Mucilaginibacter gynuensis TaxID=1302236 RepID=A0ABP8G1S1_9SPHI